MYLSIIVLPFLGSIFAGFLGRKIGITGSQLLTCFCLFLSAVLSTFAFYEVGLGQSPVVLNLSTWIDSEVMDVSWEFLFDQLTVVFCIMITYITFLILVYTIYYMEGQPHVQRFFSYLSAFAGFMLVLVTGGNYFVLFVGWEGIGIVSYLLISYFYSRIQATKAAILALTMNRLGDMGLSIGFFALFALFGTIDYSIVFSISPYLNENAITIVSLLLFSGAMAKSAQVPLSTWLPGSMEAKQKLILFLFYLPLCNFYFILYFITGSACLTLFDFNFYQDYLAFLQNSPEFNSLNYLFTPTIAFFQYRDEKGRFIVTLPRDKSGRYLRVAEERPIINLTPAVLDTLVGSLLGDGSLRFTKKDSSGKNKPNTHCSYAITLKSREYTYYLWETLSPLCTKTIPRPWPNPKTGKPASQYNFSTRSLPVLTEMYDKWYKWDDLIKRYIKVVPLDIEVLITPRSLAIWIMDDGFKKGNGVGLATECFTEEEVDRLKYVLENKFGLLVSKNNRSTSGGKKRFRLVISAKSKKILHSLVIPYLIPDMLYKLNIEK